MQTNDNEKKRVERVLASDVSITLPLALSVSRSASLSIENTSEATTNIRTNFGNFSQTTFSDGR